MADEEFRDSVRGLMTAPRQSIATMRFRGEPGREAEAAEAWAFELTYYFTRGVGEQPLVSYADGVYTVTGLMQTTHPGDGDEVSEFWGSHQPGIDEILEPGRVASLRDLYGRRGIRFDGR